MFCPFKLKSHDRHILTNLTGYKLHSIMKKTLDCECSRNRTGIYGLSLANELKN